MEMTTTSHNNIVWIDQITYDPYDTNVHNLVYEHPPGICKCTYQSFTLGMMKKYGTLIPSPKTDGQSKVLENC
jgi:hypothetical protein